MCPAIVDGESAFPPSLVVDVEALVWKGLTLGILASADLDELLDI